MAIRVHHVAETVKKHRTSGNARYSRLDDLWRQIKKLRGALELADFKQLVLILIYIRAISGSDTSSNNGWQRILVSADHSGLLSKISAILHEYSDTNLRYPALDLQGLPLNHDELRQLVRLLEEWTSSRQEATQPENLFQYCYEKFSQAERKTSGELYTPQWLCKLLVRVLRPRDGLLYDPCCGSAGLLIQAWREAQSDGNGFPNLKLFGQECNPSAWQLGKMNLQMLGIPGQLGPQYVDSLKSGWLGGRKADYILANPPFNQENWSSQDKHLKSWPYGEPPANNANFAWIQNVIEHLNPNGYAAFIMSNGTLSSAVCDERDIRRGIVEADLVDCMVALPPQLFQTSKNPASLWILTRGKNARSNMGPPMRDRHQQTLFIDAGKMGHLTDRVHRVLDEKEITRIVETYHSWRGATAAYQDIPGYCRSVHMREIAAQQCILTPARYVGASPAEPIAVPDVQNIRHLAQKLEDQFKESNRLESLIRERIWRYGIGN